MMANLMVCGLKCKSNTKGPPKKTVGDVLVVTKKKGAFAATLFMYITEDLFYLLHNGFKGFWIIHGKVCKYFAIDVDPIAFEFVHEFRI